MLLNGTYSLLGIADVEAFAGQIVHKCWLKLSDAEREDLHAWLIEETWLLSRDFRPGVGPFSAYAAVRLRQRVIDWQRQRNGRTRWSFGDGRVYERPRPQLVSLDDTELNRLESALAENGGDAAADRDEARRGLLAERDRHAARDLNELGAQPPRPRAD